MSELLVCPQCNKQFKSIVGHRDHISNNTCNDKIKKLTCSKCLTLFSSAQRLKYHNDNVICVKKIKVKSQSQLIAENSITVKKQHILEQISELLPLDKSFMNDLFRKFSSQIRSSIIDNVTINYTYNVAPAFLEMETVENIRKFYPNAIEEIITYLKEPAPSIIKIIQQTYCNPEHPIFNSIYMEDPNSGIVKVSDGKEYIDRPFNDVLIEIINNKTSTITAETKDHVDSDDLVERLYYLFFIFKYYPNYPETDTEIVQRIELCEETVKDIAEMFAYTGTVVNTPEWISKLNNDMKIYCTPKDKRI